MSQYKKKRVVHLQDTGMRNETFALRIQLPNYDYRPINKRYKKSSKCE